jgi:hypothetical protein
MCLALKLHPHDLHLHDLHLDVLRLELNALFPEVLCWPVDKEALPDPIADLLLPLIHSHLHPLLALRIPSNLIICSLYLRLHCEASKKSGAVV